MHRTLTRFLLAVIFFAIGASAFAQDLDSTVLTISGKMSAETPADFSVHMLESLPHSEIVTTTPWHDGKVTFTGVLLSDVMRLVGAEGETATVTALNDFRADIPLTDIRENAPVLAYKLNGDYMSIRDKGPLFIIYPFDEHPELKSELFYSRSVWQVRSIEIK